MMNARHWASALGLSAVVHLALGIVYQAEPAPGEIALNGGEGIEIGLATGDPQGQAAGTNSSLAPQESTQEIEPAPEPEPLPHSEQEPQAEPEPEPVVEAVEAPSATENLVAVEEQIDQQPEPAAPADTQPEASAAPVPVQPIGNGDGSNGRQPGSSEVYANGHPGGGKANKPNEYFGELMAWMNQHKRYPVELKKKKQQGVVELEFTVNRDGQVLDAKVAKSCGHGSLDQAALQMLEDAAPLPPIPEFIRQDSLTLLIPVEYSLITNAVNPKL